MLGRIGSASAVMEAPEPMTCPSSASNGGRLWPTPEIALFSRRDCTTAMECDHFARTVGRLRSRARHRIDGGVWQCHYQLVMGGVNMLGVGLHSYGFMDQAFGMLLAFIISQLAIIGVRVVPQKYWRAIQAREKASDLARISRAP
jgi:hypothetical protein